MTRSLSIDCPNCAARVRAEIAATIEEPEDDFFGPLISLARCPGCSCALVARQNMVGIAGSSARYSDAVRIWPAPVASSLWPNVPTPVQRSLAEAQICRDAGASLACTVMCGRALEDVCKHHGAPSATLEKGLDDLLRRKIIDERLASWAHELRRRRNLAAHASDTVVSSEDATDQLHFVEAIVQYVFVLSARFEAFIGRKGPLDSSEGSSRAG